MNKIIIFSLLSLWVFYPIAQAQGEELKRFPKKPQNQKSYSRIAEKEQKAHNGNQPQPALPSNTFQFGDTTITVKGSVRSEVQRTFR